MPQSLAKIILHIIFSTKDRKPLIFKEYRDEMHAYIGTVCKSLKSIPIIVGGTEDHVHIAATFPRTITVCDLLEEIKRSSSRWFKNKDTRLRQFSWQCGYGVFSISQSHKGRLVRYIENQEEHHRKKTFKGELRELLKSYEVEYDEGLIWE
jgi:putative transposase